MCSFSLQNLVNDTEDGNLWPRYSIETQFLIVEAHEGDDESAVYTFFLPILEGDFSAVLQGNELEICLESGSHLVFVGAGLNPYDVITKAVKTMERHLQTFSPPAEWFLCCCSVIIWALFNIWCARSFLCQTPVY